MAVAIWIPCLVFLPQRVECDAFHADIVIHRSILYAALAARESKPRLRPCIFIAGQR